MYRVGSTEASRGGHLLSSEREQGLTVKGLRRGILEMRWILEHMPSSTAMRSDLLLYWTLKPLHLAWEHPINEIRNEISQGM